MNKGGEMDKDISAFPIFILTRKELELIGIKLPKGENIVFINGAKFICSDKYERICVEGGL